MTSSSNNEDTLSVSLQDVVKEAKSLSRIFTTKEKDDEQSSISSAVEREPLKVIGAGLGRTGTSSLKVALNKLGYKTYHMDELALSGHAPVWAKFARSVLDGYGDGDGRKADIASRRNEAIDVMAKAGYNATTDFPACLIFEDLMDTYPSAKVILSVRSSGEVWAESVRKTLAIAWPTMSRRPWGWLPQLQPWQDLLPFIWTSIGALPQVPPPLPTDTLDADLLANAHDRWAGRVLSVVPPERLLVHTSSDGYEPLCSFLGVSDSDCPSEEYPRSNEAKEMVRTFNAMDIMALGFDTAVTTIALVACVRLGMKMWRRNGQQEEKVSMGKKE